MFDLDELQHSKTPPQASCIYEQEQSAHKQLQLHQNSTNGTSPLAPALYVLGDSLLDSGNNNYLQTIIKANYSPYGEDFVNKCTGRFSNGKTVADFIAEFLGLPYAPPFLSFKPRDKLPLTGLNYASGACGILRDTGHHLRLYNLGARKIVVSEIGPIGCVPAITSQNKHKGKCVEHKNQLVSEYNSMLPAMLQNLTSSLQGSSFVNGHAYRLASDAIINPSNYGLKDASNPCCKTWLSGIEGCIPFVEPCDRRDKYYFWDGYHPSEIVYSLFASRCINNASFCSPFSLKELVKM
ncbi:GDSL esterase/lipase 7 [Citrus sinensis]|uniref:GDSL esterase/lipase 7 n=1 Tax=Citrus sinensis TaxID=2711 RepID=A0ACB8K4S5_CITSI|nr:GDSL esterase/lipase 7 [Citrus sinensis]